ncbi:MAG: peptidylprolyl isomerase [Oscillospiraceae bacterium]|nr:peptidylprolyl isomerase [Oscillospiraceae bacterium]
MKRIKLGILLLVFVTVMFSGCGLFSIPYNPVLDYDFTDMQLVQLQEPVENQPVITVYTTLGTFTAMLFPEHAPRTVENFIERINDGFYENKPILAVQQDEYLLTGAYDELGRQGVTSDGKLIPNELSPDLWPFKGAMLAFSATHGYGDSRFLIVGSVPFTPEAEAELREAVDMDGNPLLPDELIEAFLEHENIAAFMGLYTTFGQIIDGFDVLDELLTIPTQDDSTRPLEEHFIERIVIS